MRRLALPALLVLTLLVPAACGSNEVDEATLPTPVPTYTTEASAAVAEAAPTEAAAEAATDTETASAAETPAEAVAESDAASQDQAAGAAAENTTEPAATEAATATATPEPTATPAPTEAAEPTATVAPTATPEPTTPPEPTATPEPTAAPDSAADSGVDSASTDSEFAGVPEGVAALIPNADVARGEQLTLQNACIGCHNLNPDLPMAGPTWHNVAETAATRVEGENAPAYLYNSIVHPNDYVVDGYAPGVMIQTYGDTLSDQDLADIIGYLLTLKGQ